MPRDASWDCESLRRAGSGSLPSRVAGRFGPARRNSPQSDTWGSPAGYPTFGRDSAGGASACNDGAMDIYRFVAAHISETLTTVGLLMDIAGIWLMFLFGGIGAHPVEFARDRLSPWYAAPTGRYAQWASLWGLGLATLGFVLQIVAQWM